MSHLSCVLLVEDDPNDAELIAYAFRKGRVRSLLTVIGDGEQAIRHLAGGLEDEERYPLPAVVLLDLKLPRIPGFSVLAWVRANPRLRHLPVVVLTSSDREEDIRQAYELQANSYLVKPVGRDILIDMVQTLSHYWTHLNHRPA